MIAAKYTAAPWANFNGDTKQLALYLRSREEIKVRGNTGRLALRRASEGWFGNADFGGASSIARPRGSLRQGGGTHNSDHTELGTETQRLFVYRVTMQ